MMCSISASRQFSNYWFHFIVTNFRSRKTRPLNGEVETKSLPDDSYQWRITSKQWRPTLTQVPHSQMAEFEQSSSPLHRMYVFLLVRTNESHVILCNAFPHLEAISPRIHSDQLDSSGPDLRWQKLPCVQISGCRSHKGIPASVTY
jgi:hypothetical protein